MKSKMIGSALTVILIGSLGLGGCSCAGPNQSAGAVIGGVTGAIVGASLGGSSGGAAVGAGIGAAAGGLIGGAIGRNMDEAE